MMERAVRITYDKEVDAVYIRLIEGAQQCRAVRLTDEIALNIGDGERLVGIEIIDAKRVLGQGNLPQVVVDNLPVKAA